MAKGSFQKFIDRGEKGARKKEQIRQEKKKIRQETNAYFEQKKKEARLKREGKFDPERSNQSHPSSTRDNSKKFQASDKRNIDRPIKAAGKRSNTQSTTSAYAKASADKAQHPTSNITKASTRKDQRTTSNIQHPTPNTITKASPRKAHHTTPNIQHPTSNTTKEMPLNKYIAHSGICSRRDAAELVKGGKVLVNGSLVNEPGFKVSEKDEVKVNGKKIAIRKNMVYILLNKPKDFITTTEDPEGRKTVLSIISQATEERVYPIGRLDRNTTGVLLFTNDGELAQKLSHPSYQIKKIYEVKLDKPLTKKDFDAILNGVTLEDGFVSPDSLAYADAKDKSVIGIEIHSGRNRIVRRIFESLGYDVRNLDRVMYANLTKKNVERGKWRFLTEKEVRLLKYMNASYTRSESKNTRTEKKLKH
jgi:23S rRNA pseudouridine2605 synthase